MRFLTIDIETSPHLVEVWSLRQDYIDPSNIVRPMSVLSFAAKWLDGPKVEFRSSREGGMVERAWELLNEADAVIHYNGRRFDVPHLNTQFVQAGLVPPASYWQIDLLKEVRKQFNFASNRLSEVVKSLDLGEKMKHDSKLQSRCVAGEESAWAELRSYNIRDVEITERLYLEVRPWIRGHPNLALASEGAACPRCGSENLRPEGSAYTRASEYGQYRCLDCGSLSRNTRRTSGATVVDAVGQ